VLDIPTRGVKGIQVEKTKFENSLLTIISSSYNISVKGTVVVDDEIDCVFRQGSLNLPLKLSKIKPETSSGNK
jgi:hypothetical protein